VVVATATPINDRFALQTKLAPYRTYAIAAPIDPGVVPDVLAWDTCDPYHYVRLAECDGTTYAIFGGEDHKTGQSDDERAALVRLDAWAMSNFAIDTVTVHWSGQVMETIDGLGFIGVNPGDRNVFVVAGDSGMGMTHGTIAGILIPALIYGEDHPWRSAYDPSRKPIGAVGTFIGENLNVAAQITDFVTQSEVPSLADIVTGEGAVLRHGLSKIAAYRDDRHKLHVRSAVCPHLGCIVHWNKLEKVWDCPCHGSQFDPTGRVLHGPAVHALASVDDFDRDKNPNLDPINS
jgi:Rieske Fe-S protein